MSIDLSTFWTTWNVLSGDTSSTNQYDFWRGIIMDDNTQLSSQYDFFKYHNTTRYEFFKNLNSTYPEVWDETTFYQNTNDARIYDFNSFFTYAAETLPGGGPVDEWYSNTFNCSNPFNTGNVCGCPTSNLTSAYAACEDYNIWGCQPTFYWYGTNATEPEVGNMMATSANLTDVLSGEGTFWISDESYGYEIDNTGEVISKQICEPLRTINLLGEFSSWSGGYELTTTDNVNYIYSGASLPGGDVKFRQDNSWTVNWGGLDFPSGIGVQEGPNIPSTAGNWVVTFNRLTGAYNFVPVLTVVINPSFTIVNDNVTLYATTDYPTAPTYTWSLTDFYETATDEPITSFTGDTLPEGYFTSSGSSNVTLTAVAGIQTATTSTFSICPFAVSGSITPSSAYTNTNVILSGSSNYDGGYVDYTWYLTDFYDASTDEPITYYNGQVLPEGYFTSTGDTNVNLQISSCGNPFQAGIDVYEAPPAPMNASGGTITTYTSGGTTYRVHTFTSNGTFTVNSLGDSAGNIDVLLVGGGGKGGDTAGNNASVREYGAGGGGAGGAIFTSTTVSTTSYSLFVGSGNTSLAISKGGDTSGFTLTSIGGGNGGYYSGSVIGGTNGGSGGGGAQNSNGGTGTAGQGNNGGNGSSAQRGTGAGGGAGAVGGTGLSSGTGAAGGIGIQSDITGTLLYYAGGGGAGRSNFTTGGLGGDGGGGNGGTASGSDGSNATFYGGGGGGAGEFEVSQSPNIASGGNGYQGVVIIRYPI